MKYDKSLDASGLLCPEPLMLVRKAVREMAAGEILYVVATDPSTERDLANFCRFMRHEMVHQAKSDAGLEFWIRKAP